MIFNWDEKKNQVNIIKHGVSFEEAETVFDDENAVLIYDEDHSYNEERFILIGLDRIYRNLTVCHCYSDDENNIIRIFSARKATAGEIDIYFGGKNENRVYR